MTWWTALYKDPNREARNRSFWTGFIFGVLVSAVTVWLL